VPKQIRSLHPIESLKVRQPQSPPPRANSQSR